MFTRQLIFLLIGASLFGGCRMVKSMVYPAPAVPVQAPPNPYLPVSPTTENGDKLDMWVLDPEGSSDVLGTVLFFHGNGENLETLRLSGKFEALRYLGCTAVAIDYPGYGRSSGSPSEKSLAEAADAALGWVVQNRPDAPVFVCGWSLGAGVAAGVAKRHDNQIHGVVLLSPWTTLADVAGTRFPRFLVRMVLRDRYDSIEAVKQITTPVLVMHGTDDRVIPFSQGRQLAEKTKSLYKWVPVEGAGHTQLLSHPLVRQELNTFITAIVKE
jgi:hypothetical protein